MPDSNLKDTLIEVLGLKKVERAGWLLDGVESPESVAAHSWGVAFLATQLCPEGLDRERVIEMCVVHDIAEVRVGDITPFDGVSPEDKHRMETEAMASMQVTERTRELFAEYEAQETAESRFVLFLDRLDMALQADIYEEQGLDLARFKIYAQNMAAEYGFEW